MSEILLSIHPEYVSRILKGTKKFEYRRRIPKKKISKIIIYSTHPEMKVVGEVEVLGILELNKSQLWEETKMFSGITQKKYREYFKDRKVAFAYELGEVTRYYPDKKLSDYDINYPPQSFVYLK